MLTLAKTMVEHIETQSDGKFCLRVDFVRQEDRFGHVIQLLTGDVAVPLFASREGIPADDWPASPVLQQLHIENRPSNRDAHSPRIEAVTRQVALLVGMAGRNHWSLSVETGFAEGPTLVFDAACRLHPDPSAILRSTYHMSLAPLVESGRCEMPVAGNRRVTVDVQEIPGQDCATNLQALPQGICLSPEPTSGATRRWRYRVSLASERFDPRC